MDIQREWSKYDCFLEHFFFVRVPDDTRVILTANPDQVEAPQLDGHRWWTPAEIASAADQRFVPRALAELLAPLLDGAFPAVPLPIGL